MSEVTLNLRLPEEAAVCVRHSRRNSLWLYSRDRVRRDRRADRE